MFNLKNLVNKKFESIKAQLKNNALNLTGTFSVLVQKNDTAFNFIADIKTKITKATKVGVASLKLSVAENFKTTTKVLDGYFDYTLIDNDTELQNKACSIEGVKTNTTRSMNFVCDFNAFGKDVARPYVETQKVNKELGLSDKIIIKADSGLAVPFNMSYTVKNLDPYNNSNSPEMFEAFISSNGALNSLAGSLKDSFQLFPQTNTSVLDVINLETMPFFSNDILGFDIDSIFGNHYNDDETNSAELSISGDTTEIGITVYKNQFYSNDFYL